MKKFFKYWREWVTFLGTTFLNSLFVYSGFGRGNMLTWNYGNTNIFGENRRKHSESKP